MSRLDQQQAVAGLAAALGLDWRDPITAILRHCNGKIAAWLKEARRVGSLDELQLLICRQLHLVFEEFHTEGELTQLIAKYVSMGEVGFAGIRATFNDDVYATLTERRHMKSRDEPRYIAFIDLRGDKAARRYFTRWHEIAHLLTLVKQLELPFHRSTKQRDPIEQLMDVIAGDVGFYDPIFRPTVERAFDRDPRLTFAAVENIRAEVCPGASFHATLIACAKRWPASVITLEVGLGLKKAEVSIVRSGQLGIFSDKPEMKLRAIVAIGNEAAKKARFRIHQNMRIPEASLLSRHFADTDERRLALDTSGRENLAIWQHSDGTSLGHLDVFIEARRLHDHLVALVRPVE